MKGPGITIRTNGLIAGRPDMRGLWHETVKEYLARGGRIKVIKVDHFPGIKKMVWEKFDGM
jgi:hypothetical protein